MNGIYKTYANYRAKANKHRMTWKMKMKRDIFAYLTGRKRDGSVERERERTAKPCKKGLQLVRFMNVPGNRVLLPEDEAALCV